jgi:hypothetical protein
VEGPGGGLWLIQADEIGEEDSSTQKRGPQERGGFDKPREGLTGDKRRWRGLTNKRQDPKRMVRRGWGGGRGPMMVRHRRGFSQWIGGNENRAVPYWEYLFRMFGIVIF